MELQELIGALQDEVHVQHVQGEHGQLHGAAQRLHLTHQMDQDEVKNAMMQL
jgi:hypothetical protein